MHMPEGRQLRGRYVPAPAGAAGEGRKRKAPAASVSPQRAKKTDNGAVGDKNVTGVVGDAHCMTVSQAASIIGKKLRIPRSCAPDDKVEQLRALVKELREVGGSLLRHVERLEGEVEYRERHALEIQTAWDAERAVQDRKISALQDKLLSCKANMARKQAEVQWRAINRCVPCGDDERLRILVLIEVLFLQLDDGGHNYT